MKMEWVKLNTDTFKDSKVRFMIKRHGWDCWGVFSGLMMDSDNGVLTLPEEIFADSIMIEEPRFYEIISILEKYDFIFRNEAGLIELSNWSKYQVSEDQYLKGKEKNRDRQRVYRAKKEGNACHNDVTLPKRYGNSDVTPLDIDLDLDKEGEREEAQAQQPALSLLEKLGPEKNISLSRERLKALETKYNFQTVQDFISQLSRFKKSSGKVYADDGATLEAWIVRAGISPESARPPAQVLWMRCKDCGSEHQDAGRCPKCDSKEVKPFRKIREVDNVHT